MVPDQMTAPNAKTNRHQLERQSFALVLALWFSIIVVIPAQAQVSTTATASTTIVTAISLASSQTLAFGNIMPGVPKTVARNVDASSAIFSITGDGLAGISIQLTLPEYLALSDGSARLPISFSSTDATVDSAATTPAGAAVGWVGVDPRALSSANIGGAGQTNLYLGGKVTPGIQQKSGSYTGDIVLTVSYNGT